MALLVGKLQVAECTASYSVQAGDPINVRSLSLIQDKAGRFVPGVLLILLCLGLLLFRTPELGSRFFSNAGLIALNHASTKAPLETSQLTRAEQSLQTAVLYSQTNASASRALGYIFEARGLEDEARAIWQSAGTGMAVELIERGLRARKNEQFTEAKRWFERAANMDPQLGDPWYYLGLTNETEQDWSEAAQSYEQGLMRGSKLKHIGLSNFHFQLGRLQDELAVEKPWASALAMYDQAIEIDDFTDEWSRTQTLYRRGEALDILGRKDEAAKDFAAVIDERPDDEWAYIKLGRLVWELDHDQIGAEKLYRRALDINDENKWVYRGLGQIFQESGRDADAVEMYERVLRLDPDDVFVQQQLDKIISPNATVGD